MVIYVPKTRNLENFAQLQREAMPDLEIVTMHKSLAEDTRNQRRVLFGLGKYDVLCTTDVSGAGIDWRNVRTSVHWGAVSTTHLLVQHMERAGNHFTHFEVVMANWLWPVGLLRRRPPRPRQSTTFSPSGLAWAVTTL